MKKSLDYSKLFLIFVIISLLAVVQFRRPVNIRQYDLSGIDKLTADNILLRDIGGSIYQVKYGEDVEIEIVEHIEGENHPNSLLEGIAVKPLKGWRLDPKIMAGGRRIVQVQIGQYKTTGIAIGMVVNDPNSGQHEYVWATHYGGYSASGRIAIKTPANEPPFHVLLINGLGASDTIRMILHRPSPHEASDYQLPNPFLVYEHYCAISDFFDQDPGSVYTLKLGKNL